MNNVRQDETFTSDDLALFERMIAEVRGPHAHEMGLDLGFAALDLYDAIAARARTVRDRQHGNEAWVPDEIDLAGIRVLAGSILKRHYAPEFQSVTGRTFQDVESLRAKASAMVRQRRGGAGVTSITVGETTFQFPARVIPGGSQESRLLIGVPDSKSWAMVYTHISDADTLRAKARKVLDDLAHPSDLISEFRADSYWELQQQLLRAARELSAAVSADGPRSTDPMS